MTFRGLTFKQLVALVCNNLAEFQKPGEQVDWQQLEALMEHHQVFTYAADFLLTTDSSIVPEALRTRWNNRINAKKIRSEQIRNECIVFLNECNKRRLCVVPYKGPSLAEQAYKEWSSRECIDLDFFVFEDLKTIEPALRDLGYQTDDLKTAPGSLYQYFQGEWCWYHPEKRIALELHWRAGERFRCPQAPNHNQLQKETSHQTILGAHRLALNPEIQILLLSMHAAKHDFGKLKWLLDLDGLIRNTPTLDWNKLISLANEARAEHHLASYFQVSSEIFDISLPIEMKRFFAEHEIPATMTTHIRNTWIGKSPSQKEHLKLSLQLLSSKVDKCKAIFLLCFGLTPKDIQENSNRSEFRALLTRPFRVLSDLFTRKASSISQEMRVLRLYLTDLIKTNRKTLSVIFALYGIATILEASLLVGFLPLLLGAESVLSPLLHSQDPIALAALAGLSATALGLFRYLHCRISEPLPERYALSLRKRILSFWSLAPWGHISQFPPGELLHSLTQDVDRIAYLSNITLRILSAGTSVFILSLFALHLSFGATVFAASLVCIFYGVLLSRSGRFRRSGERLHLLSVDLFDKAQESFKGSKWLAASGLRTSAKENLHTTAEEYCDENIELAKHSAGQDFVSTVGAALILLFTLAVGKNYFELSEGSLLALFLIAARLYSHAGQMLASAVNGRSLLSSFSSIQEHLIENANFSLPEPSRTERVSLNCDSIAVNNMTFAHTKGPFLFRRANLSIEKGDAVILSGPSGIGKTTLLDLLLGLLVPQSGTIRIDGRELEGEVLSEWQKQTAYLTQDLVLFGGSVRENLQLYLKGCPENQLRSVLEIVGLDTWLQKLPLGLETEIGPGGVKLSGGERQRLALARALLRQPKVLILDEATNALDVETEKRFFQTLFGKTDRPIVLMVSHRPGVCELFNRHLEIRDQQILENARVAERQSATG